MIFQEELVAACNAISVRISVAAYNGNLSARVNKNEILISQSGKYKSEIRKAVIHFHPDSSTAFSYLGKDFNNAVFTGKYSALTVGKNINGALYRMEKLEQDTITLSVARNMERGKQFHSLN